MGYDARVERHVDHGLLALRLGASARPAVEQALGLRLPPMGTVQRGGERLCLPRAPDEWLLADRLAALSSTHESIDGLLADGGGVAAVVSDAYTRLTLRGPHAEAVLSQLVALDLQGELAAPDSAWPTALGQVKALVHRVDAHRFDLYVDAAVERYAEGALRRCRGTLSPAEE